MKKNKSKKMDVQKDMLLTNINNIFEQMMEEREKYVNIQVYVSPSNWDSDKVIRQVLDGEDIESVIEENCPTVTQDEVDDYMGQCEQEINDVVYDVNDFIIENSEHYDELVELLTELQTLVHG